MQVIATAGHVDHGKSALVEALTGTHPDRLAEEQARQMTIDLGFAWLPLPSGNKIGIVDVPGHEDFIANMLAGVGGIDVALLVVAVDEGFMPQTQEHLAILDLLNIPRLVVALTKSDLPVDADWRELVMLDIEERIGNTHFKTAPIVPISAHNGLGITELVAVLDQTLAEIPDKPAIGTPRLPVDRVFTLKGFGTVVTGTLLEGSLSAGQTIVIMPQGLSARIRGLHAYQQAVEVAEAGSRVAVNLAGIDKHEVKRGDVLTLPDTLEPTTLLDVELSMLIDVIHNAQVKVFIGTASVLARVRLLSDDSTRWAQLLLEDPSAVVPDQRFILRLPSPPTTIGGGRILDPHPARKWKRNVPATLEHFQRMAKATPQELALEKLRQTRRPLPQTEILVDADPEIVGWGDWMIHQESLTFFQARLEILLAEFHAEYPLRIGMPIKRLANLWHLSDIETHVILELLAQQQTIALQADTIALSNFQPRYTPTQQKAITQFEATFATTPYTPLSIKESLEILGDTALLESLVEQGQIVRLNADVILGKTVFAEWLDYAKSQLDTLGEISPGEFRDRFGTSRKYVVAFLEYLESRQLTRRVGDVHKAGRGNWSHLTHD